MTGITIPDTVTTIESKAFEGCTGLTGVQIPSGVTGFSADTFTGCTNLTDVYFEGAATYSGASLTGAEGATIHVSSGSGNIGATAADNVTYSMYEDKKDGNTQKTLVISGTGNMADYTDENDTNRPWKDLRGQFNKVVIEEGITHIGAYTFADENMSYGSTKKHYLTEVTIPKSVTTIGKDAFYNNQELQTVNFAEGSQLESIGEESFYNCAKLTGLSIPATVKEIQKNAFNRCNALTSLDLSQNTDGLVLGSQSLQCGLTELTLPVNTVINGSLTYNPFPSGRQLTLTVIPVENNTVIPDSWITLPSGIQEIIIGYGITEIGNYAFDNNDGYKNSTPNSIIIPSSVTKIGDYAFRNLPLASITIPDSVTTIGQYAFAGTSIESITIPNSVTSIGKNVFRDCKQLTSATIPTHMTSLPISMFNGCTNLTQITIPDGVTVIDGYAFNACRSLESIEIPKGVTTIGECAFFDCQSLKKITIPNGVKTINQQTFYTCKALESIVIPQSVTKIDQSAFSDCTSLKTVVLPGSITSTSSLSNSAFNNVKADYVYYGGTESQWNSIKSSFTSVANVVRYDATGCEGCGIAESTQLILWDDEVTLPDVSGVTAMTVLDTVTSIDQTTLDACTNLATITWKGTDYSVDDFKAAFVAAGNTVN